MRIGVIAPPWTPVPPRGYGGIAYVVDRLVQGFQAAGHEVLLFATGDSTSPVPRKWALPRSPADTGAPASATGGSRRLAPEWADALREHLTQAYEAVAGFDIVHDHTAVGPHLATGYPGLKVVTTLHNLLGEGTVDAYQTVSERAAIIAVSRAQHRQAPRLPIARTIHHGIDAAGFPLGTGDGGYLLFLGRMAPEKGVHRAVLAASEAGVPLLIAAKMRESWEHQYFRERIEPHLNARIRYVGEVAGEEKARLLGGARAVINPIDGPEAFGLVMLEAMACGTPVLAYPEGAASEIVDQGRTGYVCRDVPELVDAIGRIAGLDRAACRRTVETRFSAERMVAEHLDFFAELLAGGSGCGLANGTAAP
jgi:glycosyltransferase involved in cell wall biosynthesis